MNENIFISINPPQEVKNQVASLLEKLKAKDKSVNWTEAENFHLTLIFLGNINEARTAKVTAILKFITKNQNGFMLQFGDIEFFPSLNPKIIWIREDNSLDLFNLQKNLDSQLKFNSFDMGDRQFIPHFTLGRINKDIKDQDGLESLFKTVKFNDFYVDHMDVMRSFVVGNKIKHERLFRVPLSKDVRKMQASFYTL
jgi:2'-5' RNA ligase